MSVVKWESKKLFLFILFLQFVFYATVFFKIPIIRQAVGFIYFTFIPGFVFISLLKLDERNWNEVLLLSVGLSIAFLMFGGLLINESLFMFGIMQPLSPVPLIIIFNIFVLIGGFLVCLKGKNSRFHKADLLQLSPYTLLLVSLPILSIIGAMLVNTYENNIILLFMIVVISLLFIFLVFSTNLLLSKLYPFAVFMIAIALLYQSSFISNYLISFGSDAPIEFYVFKITKSNVHWNMISPDLQFGRINAMLSVTVLPAVYSNLLNIDSTWMFKIVFPLIFSLVPLGLFQIWRKYIGEKRAFISAFLFMAYETFYTEMLGLNRQMIGELFLVLLLFVIIDKKMNRLGKMVCFIIFSFGLVVSHYGISEIFLLLISFALFSSLVMKKPNNNVTLSMFVLFFIVMFGWYIFTSKSAVFNTILEYGDFVYRQLGDFFNLETREPEVIRGLGLEAPPTIWNAISRVFAYATQFFIIIGFFGLMTKRSRANYEREYFMFTLAATAFLIALIVIPGLANTMNMTRFYHVLLFFLAPLYTLGADFLAKFLLKRKSELAVSVLLLLVLVPYFLFQTSFVYEVLKVESWSVSLSNYRMSPYRLYASYGYVDAYSVYGAQWLSTHINVGNSQLYADTTSRENALITYGTIYKGYVNGLSNVTRVAVKGVVYLSTLNVIHEVIIHGRHYWNLSEASTVLNYLGIVYSNGGSIIYKKMP
ncbi:MAG: DUF2206 domain-containing protein [Candidatus Bathyarchaeia archaeon]